MTTENIIKKFFEFIRNKYCIDLKTISKPSSRVNLYFRYACGNNSYKWDNVPYYNDWVFSGGLGFKGKVKSFAHKAMQSEKYVGYRGAIYDPFSEPIVISLKEIKIPEEFYFKDFGIDRFPKNFDLSFCQYLKPLYFDWHSWRWKEVSVGRLDCFFYSDFYLNIFYLPRLEWQVGLGFGAFDDYGRRYDGGLLLYFTELEDIFFVDYLLDKIADKIGLNFPKELSKISKILGG